MDGKGKLYYASGKLAYDGEWKDNMFHGYGVLFNENPTILNNAFRPTDFSQLDK